MKQIMIFFAVILMAFNATAQVDNAKPELPQTPKLTVTDSENAVDTVLPPGAVRHAARILTFEIDQPFVLYWKHGDQKNQFQMMPIIKNGPGKNVDKLNQTQIQKLTISVYSITDPKTTYDLLKQGLTNFFNTRGLILQPGSDFGDAVYWGASFLEIVLHLQNSPKISTDVVSIRGRDRQNNHVIFHWEQLRHYPFPKPIVSDSPKGETITIDKH